MSSPLIPFASDLSLQVLQRIRRESEQAFPVLHESDRRVKATVQVPVVRESRRVLAVRREREELFAEVRRHG